MDNEVEIEHRLTAVEAKASSNTKRLDAVEKNQQVLSDLATGVKVMGTKLETLTSTVNKLDSKVDEIEKKPGKRYDGLVEKIIWACVAAVITFVLSRVGL